MKLLIVGSGISGLCAAIEAAEKGCSVQLVSTFPSERSQSVMAAGGINVASSVPDNGKTDSPEIHMQDTLRGGCFIENEDDLTAFCKAAPECLDFLKSIGVRFNRDKDGNISRRAFGGQSRRRTAYAGASTGKQIVTALTNKCREYEINGLVTRSIGLRFLSALIRDGRCYGALFYDEIDGSVVTFYADSVIMATGGQNRLFGKTTGSASCDGYAAAKLFTQGVNLRNLEFIQYHPTTIETDQKRMLITEAARGEGGRLFYNKDNGERCYFMEEQYGENGNLMPRDIVSRCIYNCHSPVYLDITFLGEKLIHRHLEEIYRLCMDYINLDVTKEPIPVAPAVHFFMGGIAVDSCHRTNISGLYAVGECASKYHGANRLGGNSLLAAVYSGRKASDSACNSEHDNEEIPDFSEFIKAETERLNALEKSRSTFPAVYIMNELSKTMNDDLGIVRDRSRLEEGLESIRFYRKSAESIRFDPYISLYENYRIPCLLALGEAVLMSALAREESRGAHYRSDYPESSDAFRCSSVASCDEYGRITITFDKK